MRAKSDNGQKNRKYRVLHLRKEFERNLPVFINVVKGVDNTGFSHIICYLGENRRLHNNLADLGYEVLYLGFRKKQLDFFNPLVVLKLSKVLKEKRIDMIHCHKHKPAVYGTLASIVSGRIPVIAHVHGLFRTRSLKRRVTNWMLLKFVKRIIAVSESVRRDVIESNWRIDPLKVVTVKNCIDLSTIDNIHVSKKEARLRLGLSEDEIVFGTVGRLAATKGQFYLLEAFTHVRTQLKSARLVVVGNGPLREKLENIARDSGVLPWVSFTGYRDDVFELLKGFDIFVLPSLAEGLSIALLEAMASRLPVIASNVGGIPEVFGGCQCGSLVPARDASALASAMIEIGSADSAMKNKLGEHGRQRIEEEFTTDVMIKKLTDIYESVLKGNSRGLLSNLTGSLPDNLNTVIDERRSFSLKKQDVSTTVGIIRGNHFGLPHDLLVKRFNYRGFFDFLIHMLFNDRAKRLWDISLSLYKKGLPVPEPVSYVKLSFTQRNAFYLSFVIENAESLWKVYKKGSFRENNQLIKELAGTIAEWHLKGAVHGDLKWPNILVQKKDGGYAFFLIDLDQSRLYSSPSLKGISTDLKRFYRFGLEIGAEQWVESEFFPEYIACLSDEMKTKIDLIDIKQRATTDWIRKGLKKYS